MELEESTFLIADYTTKLQSLRQYGTVTKTEDKRKRSKKERGGQEATVRTGHGTKNWFQIMASSPIIPWQIDGETVETVTGFIFLGSKITAGGDCSYKIKRCLTLGSKAMTNLDSILKSRDITLSTKVYIVKAMVFPIVMYRCESWTVKKTEH